MTETTTTQTEASPVSGMRARVVTLGLCVPAAMALAMSASTSYRFAGERLAITDVSERMALCGAAEAAIIALTLHSWGTRSKASAWLAYLFVSVQAVPAFAVSGGIGGIVRTVLGPVLLALMLHKLLGLEVRFSGEKSTGLLASAGREIRERITARLGIGRRGADSAAIARSRAADRAVALASRRRLSSRAAVRLAVAIDAAQHGLEADAAAVAEASIVARVVRRKSVAELHSLEARHVWSPVPAVPSALGSASQSAPAGASPSAPQMRTSGASVAGQGVSGPIVLPQPRRSRHAAPSASESASDAQQKAEALNLERAALAETGRPISMRGLMREMRIGQATATELRDWLAARREQQPAEVAHVNGYGTD